MRSSGFLLLAMSILFAACSKEKVTPINQSNETTNDALTEIGLIDKWEIADRSFNNISDLSVKCCEFLEFSSGSNSNDLLGNFTSTLIGSKTSGAFVVDTNEKTIQFDFNNRRTLYKYQLTADLTFEYVEDSVIVRESWIKR